MKVSDLVDALSQTLAAPVPLAVDQAACERRGIRLQGEPLSFYLPPELEPANGADPDPCFCYLVSAPAAVGKSALANFLIDQLRPRKQQVVYVPLRGAVIGEGFFAGLLADLFPKTSKAQALGELFRGNLLVVFDGYDEVSVTAAQLQLNKLFTREIRDACVEWRNTNGAAVPSLLFLFRSVFFEHGVFDELAEYSRHLRIRYFDKRQRREYLADYLSSRDSGSKKLGERAAAIVDKFLQGFEERLSIATADVADAFFGHALVLSSFGDFIFSLLDEGEQNVYKLANEFASETIDGTQALRILHGIESQIVRREEGKFPPAFGAPEVPRFEGYPAALQEELLQALAYRVALAGAPLRLDDILQGAATNRLAADPGYISLGADDQQRFRSRYEEELRNRFSDHPFVTVDAAGLHHFRNPVYLERYLAKYLAGHAGDCRAVLQAYRSASYFLALFLLDQLGWDLSGHEGDLFHVIQLLSMSCNGWEYRVPLEWNAQLGRWEGYVESKNVSIPRFRLGDEILVVDVPAGAVLDRVDIVGGEGQAVAITTEKAWEYGTKVSLSEVTISAGEVEFDIPHLHFATVALETSILRLSDHVQTLSGGSSLTIGKWQGYRLDGSSAVLDRWRATLDEAAADNGDDVVRFRRKLQQILLWFRKHGKDTYAVYEKRFNTVALKKGRDAAAATVVDGLFRAGLLQTQEAMIVLNQEALQKYGVFYIQQNQLEFRDPNLLRALYERCRGS